MAVPEPVQFARRLFNDWLARQQRLRTRRLNVVKLEDRRLPDASFALVASTLTLDGFDGGDQLTAEFDSAAGEYRFDLQTGIWDVNDVAGGPFALSNGNQTLTVTTGVLTELQIDASAAPLSAIVDGPGGLAAERVVISGGGAVALDSTATDFDRALIAADSVALNDSDALELDGLDVSGTVEITAGGALTDEATAVLSVSGHASLAATSVTLGESATDNVAFGSLTINTTGDVTVTENDGTQLTGTNSADDWFVDDGAEVEVAGDLTADVRVRSGGILSGGGTVIGAVTVDAGGELHPDDVGNALQSNAVLLSNGSSFHVDLGGTAAAPVNSQLDVTGTVTVRSSLTVDLDPLLVPDDGTEFVLINNDGVESVTGQFSGLPEGSKVTSGGRSFVVSYRGGDGNDVVLFAGVPVYDFSQAVYSIVEGDSGTQSVTGIELIRSGNTAIASSVVVRVSTPGGAAGAESSDFVSGNVTVNFAAGQTTATVPVTIRGDLIVERTEEVSLTLQSFSSGGMAGTTQGSSTVAIENNDSAVLTITGVTADEGDGGTTGFEFEVQLSAEVQGGLRVAFATADGTATSAAGAFRDFTARTGSLNFTGRELETRSIVVQVAADSWFEGVETFSLSLGAITPNDAGIDAATFLSHTGSPVTGTIGNDDTPILVALNGTDLTISDQVQGGADSRLSMRLDAGTNELVIESTSVNLGTGSAVASNEVRIDAALVTGQIEVLGGSGLDFLEVHFAGGSPVTGTGLRFDGGSVNDGMAIIGDRSQSVIWTPSASVSGEASISVDGQAVTAIRVEQLELRTLSSVSVQPPRGADTITVSDSTDLLFGGVDPALRLTGRTGGTALPANAILDVGELILDTRLVDAVDRITIASAQGLHNVDSIRVQTGLLADRVDITGPVVLTGDLELESASLCINTPLVMTGGQQQWNGLTTLLQDAELQSSTTGPALTLQNITGNGHSLALDAGAAGDVVAGLVSGVDELRIVNSRTTEFTGPVTATTVKIEASTVSVQFSDQVSTNELLVSAGPYAVTFLAGGTVGGSTEFNNTGGVTLGDADTDVITFTGGLTSIVSTTTTHGTIQTVAAPIQLGPIVLAGPTTLSSGAGGNITTGAVTGAGVPLVLAAGTGDIDLSNPANVIGALTVTGDEVHISEADAITQANAWTTGRLFLSAPAHAITLTNALNTFGVITATGRSVTLVEAGDMSLDLVSATTLVDLVAEASILDANGAASNVLSATGDVRLSAGQDIGEAAADILTGVPVNALEVSAARISASAVDDIAMELLQSSQFTGLSGDLAFLSSIADISLATAAPALRGLSVLAPAGLITLPGTMLVPGDLRVEAADVAAAGGTIHLSAQRTLFGSNQSESIVLTARARDAAAAPGTAGPDPGQFDGRTPLNLTVTTPSAVLELGDLNNSGAAIEVGGQFALSANGRVQQAAVTGPPANSKILAGALELSGAADFELTNAANDLDRLSGSISGLLTLVDLDNVEIGTGSSFTGFTTADQDVLLQTGGLTFSQALDAGQAIVRLLVTGDVSQAGTAGIIADSLSLRQLGVTGGNVALTGVNDVDVFALRNNSATGDSTFHDIDALTIGDVTSRTTAGITAGPLSGLTGLGGDLSVVTGSDLIVLRNVISRDGVVDATGLTGERILLESRNGNILLDAGNGLLTISTDEDAATSNAVTGDSISIVADRDGSYNGDLDGDGIPDARDRDLDGDGALNTVDPVADGIPEGQVTIVGDVVISTDGGVARRFGPRPAVGETGTAFFEYVSLPLPRTVDNVPATFDSANAYLNAFDVEIGVAGEQNLTVDVDWQDPEDEPRVEQDPGIIALSAVHGIDNPVVSTRAQQFLVAAGGGVQTVGHLYTAADYTQFQRVFNRTTIVVDFSVSHHSSIDMRGSLITQNNFAQPVPGADLASTDNLLTPGLVHENGIATFRIPTVIPAPPAFFSNNAPPRVEPLVNLSALELVHVPDPPVATDFGGGAASGGAAGTQLFFQIRRQFEVDEPAEVVIGRIRDSRLIASREALAKFVSEHPELQDGAGYEIWLVTETGGQRVERPVMEFEITGGQPGPAIDDSAEAGGELRLLDVPFETPAPQNPLNSTVPQQP